MNFDLIKTGAGKLGLVLTMLSAVVSGLAGVAFREASFKASNTGNEQVETVDIDTKEED